MHTLSDKARSIAATGAVASVAAIGTVAHAAPDFSNLEVIAAYLDSGGGYVNGQIPAADIQNIPLGREWSFLADDAPFVGGYDGESWDVNPGGVALVDIQGQLANLGPVDVVRVTVSGTIFANTEFGAEIDGELTFNKGLDDDFGPVSATGITFGEFFEFSFEAAAPVAGALEYVPSELGDTWFGSPPEPLPDYFIRYTGSDNFNGIIAGADLSVAITVVPAPGAAAFSMLALPALVRRRRR